VTSLATSRWDVLGAGWPAAAVAGLVFCGLTVALLTLTWPKSRKADRIKQIAAFGPGRAVPAHRPEAESVGGVIARTALAATASVVRSGGMEARIAMRLERAGMRLRPQEWVLLRIGVTLGTTALFFLVGRWIGAVIGLLLGWLLTVLYQSVRIERRTATFAEQLPDALQLLVGSLRSGFSLPQALDSLVREAPDPVGAEFGRALAEHRLGADVSEALERVGQRIRSDDLSWAVMAVRIQREVGGNLAEVLQTTVDTMRERGRLRRHVRSLSAEGRISGWVLAGLPIALGTFMFAYRGDYMRPLIADSVGRLMLLAGSLLFVLGVFWMSRVVKVDG
jgi:Flp pilus assembly protein TadB